VQSGEVVRGDDKVTKKDLLGYISDSAAQDNRQTPCEQASTKTTRGL